MLNICRAFPTILISLLHKLYVELAKQDMSGHLANRHEY